MDDADGEGAVLRRHLLDREDLLRHLPDRAAPFGKPRPGMGRPPGGPDVEARDGVAPRHHAAIGARRLRHQHVFVARRLGLDDVARGRTADLLVARQQEGHRQLRRHAGGEDMAHRLHADDRAALHVEDPGAVALVAFPPDRQLRERADGMHRIQMRHDADARRGIPGRMREARAHAVAKAHAARDAVDPRAHQRQVARGQVHHPVHRGRVEGRALAGRPAHQPREDLLRVEGQVGGRELAHSRLSVADIARSLHPLRDAGKAPAFARGGTAC